MNEEEMKHKVGFRLCPNDVQLINHYLKRKILGLDSEDDNSIAEVKVLKHEPWDLPAFSKEKSKDRFWYFFYQLDYKYLNSKRASRKTEAGFWKSTGEDRKVWTKKGIKEEIGIKKTLVFYKGPASNKSRTNWVIHEYYCTADFPNPDAYVICRLEDKADGKASTLTHDEVESNHQSSGQSPSDFGNHVALTHNEVESNHQSSGQSSSYFGSHVVENTVIEVDPQSQADSGAIIGCDELDRELFSELMSQLYTQPLSDCNGVDTSFSSDCNSVQPQFGITEPLLSNSFSSDCNGVQPQFGTTEPLLSNSFSSDCNAGTTEPLLSNSFSSDYNGVQTQFDTMESEEDFALWISNLFECEAYPDTLNWSDVDMSLVHPLEDGGMRSDTDHGHRLEKPLNMSAYNKEF